MTDPQSPAPDAEKTIPLKSYNLVAQQLLLAMDRIRKAEAELARLRAENAGLREALEPFSRHAADWDARPGFAVCHDDVHLGLAHELRVGHLRRARAALSSEQAAAGERE